MLKKSPIFILFFLFNIPQWAQDSSQVLIAYYSKSGHTKLMAQAVAKGAHSVKHTTVSVLEVDSVKQQQLLEADAIILGSPVYNANVAPKMQEFINSWPFKNAPLKDKIGAAFTTAGGLSAGEEMVQLNLLKSMLVFGMVVAGGPNWKSAFGASAVTSEEPFATGYNADNIHPIFIKKAEQLGARIARLTHKLKN